MPHFHALVANCQEFSDAYRAAYPIIYGRAWDLAQQMPEPQGRQMLSGDEALRDELTAAVEAVLVGVGQRGLHVAMMAVSEAREHAFADAYGDWHEDQNGALRRSLRLASYINVHHKGTTT